MAYASWSVVFGEQPSAAKWNILGTNDASFNDGTGIGTNAIAAASLATSAIKLGYASTSSTQTFNANGANVDLTGLSVTVTVPSGGRDVKITAYHAMSCAAGAPPLQAIYIMEGSTYLAGDQTQAATAGSRIAFHPIARVSAPSAGSHTYKLQGYSNQNAVTTTYCDANQPAYILVEAI